MEKQDLLLCALKKELYFIDLFDVFGQRYFSQSTQENHMTTKLTFVKATRLTSTTDPIRNRRNLAIRAWQDQKELFDNPNYRKKSGQKIRPKFQTNPDGTVFLFPFKGDDAVLVKSRSEVLETIDTLIAEIGQGEFDARLVPAEGRGRRGRPPAARKHKRAA
jgi:hypothetical protein